MDGAPASRDFSKELVAGELFMRMLRKPSVRAAAMVGKVLQRVIRPAAATAPAPIGTPELGGIHLVDGDGAGVERAGEVRSEEVDGGHEDEPGEGSAGEHDGGDADADNVTDAEVLGGDIGADGGAAEEVLGAEVGLIVGRGGKEAEEIFVLEEGVEAAKAEAEEDSGGEGAAAFAGLEDVGAGGAFGVGEGLVLVDDELFAERDHEEDAEPAAEEGEGEDACRLQVKT